MKIRIVGAQLFHVDGRTHTTELIVAFRSFANAPQSDTFWLQRELPCCSEQTVAPYIINWFLTPRPCVYCAVRTEYFNLLQVNFLREVFSHSVNQRCMVWSPSKIRLTRHMPLSLYNCKPFSHARSEVISCVDEDTEPSDATPCWLVESYGKFRCHLLPSTFRFKQS